MRGVNLVVVVGTAGKDAETKYTGSGSAVTNFTLAVNEYWADKSTGERKERTEWVRCVAFGKLAEIIGQYLKKGGKVYAQGKMVTRSWDKDGQKHYTTEIVADTVQFIGGRDGAAGAEGGERSGRPAGRAPADGGAQPEPDFGGGYGGAPGDDDIPF